MRNLKRALSLALASVMLVGMMVVGASAASYPDVTAEHNVEAIEVLKAVGAMKGDDAGNFNPDNKVTRNEMAAVMARLILGEDAEKYVGSCPFTDVPNWAQKYVAACYAHQIVNGTSATTFDGSRTVTGVEAAAMMLRALGYTEMKPSDNWKSPIVAEASKIRLFKDVDASSDTAMDRNAVAQLALNALKSDVVETRHNLVADNGELSNELRYIPVDAVGSENYNSAAPGTNDQLRRQLCEKLYGNDLQLGAGTADDFSRPAARSWSWKGTANVVSNVADTPVAVFTTKTSAADVAKKLSGYTAYLRTAAADRSINNATTYASGDTMKKDTSTNFAGTTTTITVTAGETLAEAIAGETGNGKLVEIFADDNSKLSAVVEHVFTVAKVTGVSSNKERTSYSFDVSSLNGIDYVDEKVDDSIVIKGSIAKDDIVTAVHIGGAVNKTYVYPTTSFEGTQSAKNDSKETVVIDGTTYNVAVGMTKSGGTVAMADFSNSKNEATYFVDQYGCLVRTDAIASTDYAVIDAIRWNNSTMEGSAQAKLIFADATTKEVTLNSLDVGETAKGFEDKSTNSVALATGTTKHRLDTTAANNDTVFHGLIATYSVRDDGKYDLTLKNTQINSSNVATGTAAANVTKKGIPALQDGTDTHINAISGNSKTVYIVKDNGSDGTKDTKYNAYTGYQNVPSIKMGTGKQAKVSYVRDGDSGTVAKYIFIDAAAGADVGDNKGGDIVYIFDTNNYVTNGTGNDSFTYKDAVVNGEIADIEAKATSTFGAAGFYEVERNDKGVVTGAATAKYTAYNVAASASNNVLNVKTGGTAKAFSYDGTEEVWVIDTDAETVRVGNAADAMKGTTTTDLVYIKPKGVSTGTADDTTIEKMYVIKEAGTAYRMTAPASVTKAGVTVSMTPDKTLALQGDTVVWTVTVSGTADGTSPTDGTGTLSKDTFTLAGFVSAGARTAVGTPTNIDTETTLVITITSGAANTATSGTYTITDTVGAAAVSPTITWAGVADS